MSQAIAEALASLRDSLARLTQRSFDDFALFQQVTAMQFRSNEVAKRLAILLAGNLSAPGDTTVAQQLLTAGGKVSIAQPADHASVRTALAAAGDALDAADQWLAAAGGKRPETAAGGKRPDATAGGGTPLNAGGAEAISSAPKRGSKPRAPRLPKSPPARVRSSAGKDPAPTRKPAPRSRPGR